MNVSALADPALEIRPASAFVGFCAALANMQAPSEVRLAGADIAYRRLPIRFLVLFYLCRRRADITSSRTARVAPEEPVFLSGVP
jgi:hypothetical protein